MHQPINMRTFVFAYLTLVVLGIVVNLPGRPTSDTIDMLWQAANPENLHDWHSPFVTFVYGLLVPVFGAPTGALVIQSLLMMVWPAALLARIVAMGPVRSEARTAMIILWLILVMVIVALNGRLLKDVLSLAFLSVLFAVFVFSGRGFVFGRLGYWAAFAATIACLAYALVRPTSIVPFAACFILIAAVTFGRWWTNARSFVLTGLGAVLMLAAIIWVGPFLGAKKAHPERPTMVFDVAGISHFSGKNLFDRFGGFDPEHSLADCYEPRHGMMFIWGRCKEYGNLAQAHHAKFVRLWRKSIMRHPASYLRHRLAYTWQLLSDGGHWSETIISPAPFTREASAPDAIGKLGNKGEGLETWSPTVAYRPFGVVAYSVFEGWLGRPLVWISLLVIGLLLSLRSSVRKKSLGPALVATFGLANVVPYAFFAMADVERFLLPVWFCSVALLAILVEWMAERTRAGYDEKVSTSGST